MGWKTIVFVVAAAVVSADAGSKGVSYKDKLKSFKPQRFAQVGHSQQDSGKGPIRIKKSIPDVSVGMQCVILLTILYFFAGFMDLLLNAWERTRRVFSSEDEEEKEDTEWVERLKDAQEAMVHATREVPMLAIVILFSHYRVSLDLGFSGPNLDQYPEEIEVGFYVATFIVLMEYLFVFAGMSLQFCASSDGASTILKFGTLFMEVSMFLGEFATIVAVGYILSQVLTHKQASVI